MVNTASITGTSLLEEARSGDATAFDSLVGPLTEPAFKLAAVMLRNRDEAHDAVQEATIKAWQNLGHLRDEGAVRGWFFAIVANQCRSMRRGRWFSVIKVASIPREDQADDSRDVAIDLRRELAALPQTDRAALFLFFYMDLPLIEVGMVLGISPQAAKSRVHRAVTKLRLGMVEVER